MICLVETNSYFTQAIDDYVYADEGEKTISFVAMDDEKCEGFVFAIYEKGVTIINVKYLGRDRRNEATKGLGKTLMDELEKWGEERGFEKLRLAPDRSSEETLRKLKIYYGELGFREDSDPNYMIKE